ncbi:MAG: His/Gly/Thr/Pro-type tRNA ligase C-terminal domain-containing protein, partial [Dehalococcoidales bacterium]|nr:His/Gly/Thr/Pro-type tRNA ligase C-terminal domain-containing protein [Dehalococcoidales bacterium]
LGAWERFFGLLIEHYAGAFPAWLAPVQMKLIPVADRHNDTCYEMLAELKKAGIRAEVDDRSERMNLKIRQAQLEKIPYMAIVGDKEIEDSTISVRARSGEQLPAQPLAQFIDTLAAEIAAKK